MARRIALLVVLGLLGASCTSGDGVATSTTGLPTTSQPTSTVTTGPPATVATSATSPPTATPSGPVVAPFGSLAEIAMVADGDPYGRGGHPSSLQGVVVHEQVAAALDAAGAVTQLTEHGFTIVPGDTRYFHHVYEGAEYSGYPVFVTTDAAYHVWHLAFDKILREVEQQALLPALEGMLAQLVELARAQEAELAGTDLEGPANRVRQFFEAAATLVEIDVGPIGPLAEQEVALAQAASGRDQSPTIGANVDTGFISRETDYSLFRPRGHYTRNSDLERFFRAMSQLGNNAFLYSPEEGLQMGILASRALLADPDTQEQRLLGGWRYTRSLAADTPTSNTSSARVATLIGRSSLIRTSAVCASMGVAARTIILESVSVRSSPWTTSAVSTIWGTAFGDTKLPTSTV